MKKILVLTIMACMLFSSTIAYAAENDEKQVDAGVTPDSFWYSADQLFEDIQLAFTFSAEGDAKLLMQFAQERLSEAKEMTESEKTEYVKDAIEDYMEIIEDAQEKVSEVNVDEDATEEIKEELNEELEDATEVDEEIQEDLDDEQKEELSEKTEEVNLSVKAVAGVDIEIVKALREQGLGYGQIAQAALLAEVSGKPIEEVAALFTGEEKGFGDVAKELGFHPSEIKSKNAKDKDVSEEEKVADNEDNDDSDKTEESKDSNDTDKIEAAKCDNKETKIEKDKSDKSKIEKDKKDSDKEKIEKVKDNGDKEKSDKDKDNGDKEKKEKDKDSGKGNDNGKDKGKKGGK